MFTKLNKLYLSLIAVLMFNVVHTQCDMPDNSLSISGSDTPGPPRPGGGGGRG